MPLAELGDYVAGDVELADELPTLLDAEVIGGGLEDDGDLAGVGGPGHEEVALGGDGCDHRRVGAVLKALDAEPGKAMHSRLLRRDSGETDPGRAVRGGEWYGPIAAGVNGRTGSAIGSTEPSRPRPRDHGDRRLDEAREGPKSRNHGEVVTPRTCLGSARRSLRMLRSPRGVWAAGGEVLTIRERDRGKMMRGGEILYLGGVMTSSSW